MTTPAGLLVGLGGVAGVFYLARAASRPELRPQVGSSPRTEVPATCLERYPRGGDRRRFDHLFERHGSGLPVPYLRALAIRESDLNPCNTNGPAWGLMQVIEVVRRDYNKRHGTGYTRAQLLDPAINVMVASDLLARIIRAYERNHPRVPNLQADWDNPRFVELLTFGWNAGYSERAGVGHVASYLEERGIYDITIDTIHENAAAAGASRHLRRADKVRWCKGVAGLYFRERAPAVARRNARLVYRPVGGGPGDPYPEWLRSLKDVSGVYVIREREADGTPVVVYVGESHSDRLYDTLTRHFQDWRRYKGFWSGQFAEGHDPGLTYDRARVEVAVKVLPADDAIDEEARLIRRLRPRDNLLGQAELEEAPF